MITPAPADRRKHRRQDVRITVTAVDEDGLLRLPATIVNVSSSGARIEGTHTAQLSDAFYMLVPEHTIKPCRVVWREHQSLGLAFE